MDSLFYAFLDGLYNAEGMVNVVAMPWNVALAHRSLLASLAVYGRGF